MEVDLRALECQRAKAEAGARVQQEKIHADTTADLRRALALRHVSWRSSFTAISPVFFAILVAVFMFLFWKWKQPDAAAAFEKILVMVITGGLGWAAGRTHSWATTAGRTGWQPPASPPTAPVEGPGTQASDGATPSLPWSLAMSM